MLYLETQQPNPFRSENIESENWEPDFRDLNSGGFFCTSRSTFRQSPFKYGNLGSLQVAQEMFYDLRSFLMDASTKQSKAEKFVAHFSMELESELQLEDALSKHLYWLKCIENNFDTVPEVSNIHPKFPVDTRVLGYPVLLSKYFLVNTLKEGLQRIPTIVIKIADRMATETCAVKELSKQTFREVLNQYRLAKFGKYKNYSASLF